MTEPKTQYESMVDEQKQNEDICKKYNLYFSGSGYISDVFNVIKKLEIDIFNLRESLKLSQELNEIYKNDISVFKKNIEDLQKFISENVPKKTTFWIDEK